MSRYTKLQCPYPGSIRWLPYFSVWRGEISLITTCHSSTDPLIYQEEAQTLSRHAALLQEEAERRRLKTSRHSLETERSRSLSSQLSGAISGALGSLAPQRSGPLEPPDSKRSGSTGSLDSKSAGPMGKQKRALLTREYDYM